VVGQFSALAASQQAKRALATQTPIRLQTLESRRG